MSKNANIRNLELVRVAAERVMNRNAALPGIAVHFGHAGLGKSTAASVIAQELRGYVIELRSVWTRKTILQKILVEMGIPFDGLNIGAMLDLICEQIAKSNRPLIVDEFDYAAKSASMVEMFRDIYQGSQGTLLLIGEEQLPKTLEKYERFHSRVLSWIPAQPVSVADAQELAKIYCPDAAVGDDMMQYIVQLAQGSVRRVCNNLSFVADAAATEGWTSIHREQWGNRPLYSGKSPEPRPKSKLGSVA